jgi:hypothetical protein
MAAPSRIGLVIGKSATIALASSDSGTSVLNFQANSKLKAAPQPNSAFLRRARQCRYDIDKFISNGINRTIATISRLLK